MNFTQLDRAILLLENQVSLNARKSPTLGELIASAGAPSRLPTMDTLMRLTIADEDPVARMERLHKVLRPLASRPNRRLIFTTQLKEGELVTGPRPYKKIPYIEFKSNIPIRPILMFIRGYLDVLYDQTSLSNRFGDNIPNWIFDSMWNEVYGLEEHEHQKAFKTYCLWPMAVYAWRCDKMNNPLPRLPIQKMKPLFTGAFKKLLVNRTMSSKNVGLLQSIAAVKRACDQVSQTFLDLSTLKHAATVGRPPVPDTFETSKIKDEIASIWHGISRKDLAKNRDLPEPSDSADFSTRKASGGVRGNMKDRLVTEGYYSPVSCLSHTLYRMWEERKSDGGFYIRSYYSKLVENDVFLLAGELSEFDIPESWARFQIISEPLKGRGITAHHGMTTFLSTPMQKTMHGYLYRNGIYGGSINTPFELIGQPETPASIQKLVDLNDFYFGNLFDKWVSGDYSAATDGVDPKLTHFSHTYVCEQTEVLTFTNGEEVLDAMNRNIGAQTCYYVNEFDAIYKASKDPQFKELFEELIQKKQLVKVSLREKYNTGVLGGGHPSLRSWGIAFDEIPPLERDDMRKKSKEVWKVQQQNGQMMGSKLSFPHLCVINLACYINAIKEYSLEEPRVMRVLGANPEWVRHCVKVNGDDIAFPCNDRLYAIWKKWIAAGGFTLSAGKNFVLKDTIIINSKVYHIDPQHLVKQVHLMNPGLLSGVCKLTGRENFQNLSIDALYNKMIIGAKDTTRATRRFFSMNRKALRESSLQGKLNYFYPTTLGGLGLLRPKGFQTRDTKFQRQLAHTLYQNMKKIEFPEEKDEYGFRSTDYERKFPQKKEEYVAWIPREFPKNELGLGYEVITRKVPFLDEDMAKRVKDISRLPTGIDKLVRDFALANPHTPSRKLNKHDIGVQIDIENFDLILGTASELSSIARYYKWVSQNGLTLDEVTKITVPMTEETSVRESRDCTGIKLVEDEQSHLEYRHPAFEDSRVYRWAVYDHINNMGRSRLEEELEGPLELAGLIELPPDYKME